MAGKRLISNNLLADYQMIAVNLGTALAQELYAKHGQKIATSETCQFSAARHRIFSAHRDDKVTGESEARKMRQRADTAKPAELSNGV